MQADALGSGACRIARVVVVHHGDGEHAGALLLQDAWRGVPRAPRPLERLSVEVGPYRGVDIGRIAGWAGVRTRWLQSRSWRRDGGTNAMGKNPFRRTKMPRAANATKSPIPRTAATPTIRVRQRAYSFAPWLLGGHRQEKRGPEEGQSPECPNRGGNAERGRARWPPNAEDAACGVLHRRRSRCGPGRPHPLSRRADGP